MSQDYQKTTIKSMLEAAVDYLEQGISVIPVYMPTPADVEAVRRKSGDEAAKEFIRSKAKRPRVAWKKYQTERATKEELEAWFADCDQDRTGIAIITGKLSGLVVVDCDNEDAVKFAEEKFPPAPKVKTGRGAHYYYKYVEGLRNFQKRSNLPGIDFRGEGGFVVAPPSPHYLGGRYEWSI